MLSKLFISFHSTMYFSLVLFVTSTIYMLHMTIVYLLSVVGASLYCIKKSESHCKGSGAGG